MQGNQTAHSRMVNIVKRPESTRGLERPAHTWMKVNTVLEMFFLFNLGLMSLVNTVSNHTILIYYVDVVSISLSLTVFVGIVLGHIYMYIKLKCGGKLYAFIQRNQTQVEEEESLLKERSSDTSEEQYSPAHTVLRKESLIFDFELTGYDDDK